MFAIMQHEGPGSALGNEFTYYVPCGTCLACLRLDHNQCMGSLTSPIRPAAMAPHFVGGFGDYYDVRPQQTILKVPDGVTDEEIAGVNCAMSQVIYGLL